jgi:hypothetical protein
MSQENVEIARRLFPGEIDLVAVVRNEDLLAATVAALEPSVEPAFETAGDPKAVPMGSIAAVDGGSRDLLAKGLDGFVAFWREWLSAWDSWNLGPPEFIDVDEDRVLVSNEVRARSKTDGVELTIDAANLMTLHDGKLARIEFFFSREKALKAAGLSKTQK